MCLKNVFCLSVLLLLFSSPVIGLAAGTYQMTATEMTQLEDIFSQLSSRQEEQQKLLNEQTERIETLRKQLETSQREIETSKQSTEALQTSLKQANESLKTSAAEAKRTHDRLERQRDTWGAVAVMALLVEVIH